MSILKDPRVREKEFLGYVARGPCVVCLSAGAWMIYRPAAFLVGGALFVLIGVKMESA